MTANKTRVTDASVADYLSAIGDEQRRRDCETIAALMTSITGCPARMWGAAIVGFDSYHYRYPSGREGDAAVTGFASRKGDISVYLAASSPGQEQQLARLGRHRMGKSCLYIRRLADVDMGVLEQLIADSVAEVKRRHGGSGGA